MPKVKTGLVGVTGYTGMEMARLLESHDELVLTRATSRALAGKTVSEIYPFMQGFESGELTITKPDPEDLAGACELVFLAVPHSAAMNIAASLLQTGLKVVDLSADFRLRDPAVYEEWYKVPHEQTALLPEAAYGLPELYAPRIAKARLTANPGCYPTSVILGLHPALKHKLIHTGDIVADSKSGATGAGRKPVTPTLYCEVSDNFRAYGLGKHRHTPEIEQELSRSAGEEITLSFNTHLLPMNRGILSTMYSRLASKVTLEQVWEIYQKEYAPHPWVRVLPLGSLPETRFVRGTMFCDIGLVVDPRTNRLIVVSCIDNLCRGASGQALANANLMLGLDLAAGLKAAPLMP